MTRVSLHPLLFLACAVAAPGVASAEAPPFTEKTVTVTARNQRVDAAIADLFGQAGLKVKTSSAINGKINGVFVGTPRTIWTQFARAFNWSPIMTAPSSEIYTGAEIQSRSFAAADPAGIVQDAQKMRIVDSANTVAASSNAVSATGVPAFLDRISQLAGTTRNPAIVQASTTPSNAAIISPLLGPAAMDTVSSAPIRSRLLSSATTRSPYEVRIFYMRYARADDTIQKSFDRTVVIPGVASILRGMMGDGRPSNTVSTSGNFDLERQSMPRLGGRGLNSVPPTRRSAASTSRARRASTPPWCAKRHRATSTARVVEVDPTNNAVLIRDRPEIHVGL